MKKPDKELLSDMLQHCLDILDFTKETQTIEMFEVDKKTFNASILSLLHIGEIAKDISLQLKASQPHIKWHQLTGLRNRLAHDYHGVEMTMIWRVIKKNIPEFIEEIRKLLNSLN